MNAEANSATQIPGPQTIGSKRLILIGMAWLATLAVSRLPQIILQEGFGIDASWIHWLWTGTLIALLAFTSANQARTAPRRCASRSSSPTENLHIG